MTGWKKKYISTMLIMLFSAAPRHVQSLVGSNNPFNTILIQSCIYICTVYRKWNWRIVYTTYWGSIQHAWIFTYTA